MTETNAKSPASFGQPNFSQRCRSLNDAAYAVRERAVMRGCDLEGRHLSRLMRDASTDAQVNIAERKFTTWLRANPRQGRFRRAELLNSAVIAK